MERNALRDRGALLGEPLQRKSGSVLGRETVRGHALCSRCSVCPRSPCPRGLRERALSSWPRPALAFCSPVLPQGTAVKAQSARRGDPTPWAARSGPPMQEGARVGSCARQIRRSRYSQRCVDALSRSNGRADSQAERL